MNGLILEPLDYQHSMLHTCMLTLAFPPLPDQLGDGLDPSESDSGLDFLEGQPDQREVSPNAMQEVGARLSCVRGCVG
jgi:hypothetical protein